MKIIEALIDTVSPKWAAKRECARLEREFYATHRGGLTTRVDKFSEQSKSVSGGTNAQRYNQAQRRNRARRVYAEHPIGRTLLKTEVDNVIACGFTLQAKAKGADGKPAKEFNEEVEQRWQEWLNIADLRGMRGGTEFIREAYRNPRCDGDGGIVLVSQPGGRSRLQYVPGDLICNPWTRGSTPNIIDGIEVDSACRPRGFHIKSEDEFGKLDWARVDANDFIFLAPVMDNQLGVRGDTCYDTIFPLLDQFDGYVEAVTIAARMAAIFGLVFKKENAAQQVANLPFAQNAQGNQQRALTVENGQATFIGTKDDVVQVVPQQPMNQTPDFIRAMCRLMGAPFDMPLELVLKDLSQVNFSSARIGLIGYYRACRARQTEFIDRCMSRIYRWWLSREIKMGHILAPLPADGEQLRHRFVPEAWNYTDPVTDAQADLLEISMGIKTRRMAAEARSRDIDEIIPEEQATQALMRAAELPLLVSNYTRDVVDAEKTTLDPKAETTGSDNTDE